MNNLQALAVVPVGLRQPLLAEYDSIVANYAEHRWSPAELSGGRFCEIVYTILSGHAAGAYASTPSKPANFVNACRQLEQNGHVPRSFQILIPRLLPSLYEVRNNRGVGHVGGDVDPNQMDATFVLSSANWIMCELVRVYHSLPIQQAQTIVDKLSEQRVPLVWVKGNTRRILRPEMKQKQQILVLLASSNGASLAELIDWLEIKNRTYFMKMLRDMHKDRLLELDESVDTVELLPPGAKEASGLIRELATN
ncbi:hypothetical protein [uncultured Tateyamaria sp.]|uniref:hypothetical protein n=1 Tax=uncultured Tateyamaria sp. TaxID=455651 RepID=UPI002615EA28|nr:hypothetical protein [uncultured Tateyamaria sp.]